jgi:hypothetical protein
VEEAAELVDEEARIEPEPAEVRETIEVKGTERSTSNLEGVKLEVKGNDIETSPRLFPGGFTTLGITFVILAAIAFVFTVVMARYDTWIQGAAEETMGQNQRTMFIAGLLGFAVSIVVAIYDLLRTPKGLEEGTTSGHDLVLEERAVDRTPLQ